MTWPPSPLSTSNQTALAVDLRSVPLSWVPPHTRPGRVGSLAMLVNWVMREPGPMGDAGRVRIDGAVEVLPVDRVDRIVGARADRPGRRENQTPPSLPIMTCEVSAGSMAMAW